MKKLTIIVPAHNEADNITEVINRIENTVKLDHELVVVNDHSSDRTQEEVLELTKSYANLRLVNNEDEAGFANAIRAGFRNISTDIVVPVMGDLCDNLDTITVMYENIMQGYDVVCGARYIKGGARIGGSKMKAFFSSFVGRTLYYVLGIPTHDVANAFKMYRKSVIDKIEIKARGFEISMEIPLKAYYAGFRITEVPTVWREREKGKSSFNMLKLFPNYFKLYVWAIFRRLSR